MTLRGRHWVIWWLFIFLLVATIVTARQREAYLTASRLRTARIALSAVTANAAELDHRIRDGTSRKVLVPKVQARLGLRMPSDSENILLDGPTVPHPSRP